MGKIWDLLKKIILASCTRVRRSLHASFFGSSYKHTAQKVDETTDLWAKEQRLSIEGPGRWKGPDKSAGSTW